MKKKKERKRDGGREKKQTTLRKKKLGFSVDIKKLTDFKIYYNSLIDF